MPHPAIKNPLDPDFLSAVFFNHHYVESARASRQAVPLVLGLEREGGLVSRFETVVRPGGYAETLRYVERIVKFLMWSRGHPLSPFPDRLPSFFSALDEKASF